MDTAKCMCFLNNAANHPVVPELDQNSCRDRESSLEVIDEEGSRPAISGYVAAFPRPMFSAGGERLRR